MLVVNFTQIPKSKPTIPVSLGGKSSSRPAEIVRRGALLKALGRDDEVVKARLEMFELSLEGHSFADIAIGFDTSPSTVRDGVNKVKSVFKKFGLCNGLLLTAVTMREKHRWLAAIERTRTYLTDEQMLFESVQESIEENRRTA